jgi:predicted nuclease of predicted toxin-antitoxin system
LPRSLAPLLRSSNFETEDVRDVGLRGRSDEEIATYAEAKGLAIITADLGFGNVLGFPGAIRHGIVVARFPNEISTTTLNEAILAAVSGTGPEEIRGHVLVVEPGKIRLRRVFP